LAERNRRAYILLPVNNAEMPSRHVLPPFLRFLQRWAINTVAVMVAANVIPGIDYRGWSALLTASLLLGVLNALIRPLLLILSLPLVVFSLGLFILVINALLLYFVGTLVKGFQVEGFWPAFWGGMLISIVTVVLNTFTGSGESRIHLHPPRRRHGRHDPPPGQGPVIDV
jgi:putative membrane protein